MATLSLIAAMSDNYVIGRGGALPWDIKEDLQYFRDTTRGHAVIMGRKTFDSIGRALPNRLNIVVTRQPQSSTDPNLVYVDSLDAAVSRADAEGDEEVFVIGGATLYKEALPRADRLYLTIVHGDFQGDTYFPQEPDYRTEFPKRFKPDRTLLSESGLSITFLSLER